MIITNMAIHWKHSDGGRAEAGYKSSSSDCGVRAIANATGIPYATTYALVAHFSKGERQGKRKRGISHPSKGIYRQCMDKVMAFIGWEWHPTMFIGQGCKVHLAHNELPDNCAMVVSLSKHYTAVINRVVHDTYDPSRNGDRCVYGYYTGPRLGEGLVLPPLPDGVPPCQ